MKYRAKQLLNIRIGVICRAGEIVPAEYKRLDEAIKRGWVEPISDEDYLIMKEKTGHPAPPPVTVPKRGEHIEPDEGTTFYEREERFKASGDDPPRKKVDSDAIVDDGDYKKASEKDTAFEKPSPLETGEIDLAEETANDAAKEAPVGIGLETPIATLPFIQGRAIKGLPDAGINIVGDLVGKTVADLLKIKGIGEHTATELLKAFKAVSEVTE